MLSEEQNGGGSNRGLYTHGGGWCTPFRHGVSRIREEDLGFWGDQSITMGCPPDWIRPSGVESSCGEANMIKSCAISGTICAPSEAILAANRSYQYHSLVILTIEVLRLGPRTQMITPPQSWTDREQKALAPRHPIGIALGHRITPRSFPARHLWRCCSSRGWRERTMSPPRGSGRGERR